MVKGYGLTGVAGISSGVVFLSVIAGGKLGVLLIYLVPLPLMMVGLSLGLLHAAVASALAAVVVGVGTVHAVPSFALVAVLPCLVVVWRSLIRFHNPIDKTIEWMPPGRVLVWLTGIAVGLLLIGAAVLASQGVVIEDLIGRHVRDFLAQMPSGVPAEMRSSLLAVWSALFPAIACCVWLAIAALNGVLAQWTVAKAERGLRPSPAYGDIILPLWMGGVLVVAAAIGWKAPGDLGFIGRNVAVVLLWPYVFVGLAEVHSQLRNRPVGGLLLALFYVVFFGLFQLAIFAVAGLGLVRQWTRPRRRDAGGQEEK